MRCRVCRRCGRRCAAALMEGGGEFGWLATLHAACVHQLRPVEAGGRARGAKAHSKVTPRGFGGRATAVGEMCSPAAANCSPKWGPGLHSRTGGSKQALWPTLDCFGWQRWPVHTPSCRAEPTETELIPLQPPVPPPAARPAAQLWVAPPLLRIACL